MGYSMLEWKLCFGASRKPCNISVANLCSEILIKINILRDNFKITPMAANFQSSLFISYNQ